MKRLEVSLPVILFFLLALLLIATGMLAGVRAYAQFEELALIQESYEELLDSIQFTALQMMIFGSMVAIGIGILVILFLHVIRRTTRIQKEAAVLREKNEAMEAVQQNLQRLAHHQRLETLGTLTSSIAHEFNNLLTPIMGYSMMALEKLSPEEDLYDDIVEVYGASCKAKTIISRLSDLSRKNTSDTFRQISPDDLIRKTLDVATPAKPKQVEIKLDLNCQDQRIRGNEIQISQLMLNLILNGFQAMTEGVGALIIITSFDETCVHIRVEDTGCGMSDETQKRMFDPFFTTKEVGKGTGLGLAIVAQVVEDHAGRIQVNSTPGKGTAITVSLPRTVSWAETE